MSICHIPPNFFRQTWQRLHSVLLTTGSFRQPHTDRLPVEYNGNSDWSDPQYNATVTYVSLWLTGFWMSTVCDVRGGEVEQSLIELTEMSVLCRTQAAHTESPMTCIEEILLYNNLHVYHSTLIVFPIYYYLLHRELWEPLWEAMKMKEKRPAIWLGQERRNTGDALPLIEI